MQADGQVARPRHLLKITPSISLGLFSLAAQDSSNILLWRDKPGRGLRASPFIPLFYPLILNLAPYSCSQSCLVFSRPLSTQLLKPKNLQVVLDFFSSIPHIHSITKFCWFHLCWLFLCCLLPHTLPTVLYAARFSRFPCQLLISASGRHLAEQERVGERRVAVAWGEGLWNCSAVLTPVATLLFPTPLVDTKPLFLKHLHSPLCVFSPSDTFVTNCPYLTSFVRICLPEQNLGDITFRKFPQSVHLYHYHPNPRPYPLSPGWLQQLGSLETTAGQSGARQAGSL